MYKIAITERLERCHAEILCNSWMLLVSGAAQTNNIESFILFIIIFND